MMATTLLLRLLLRRWLPRQAEHALADDRALHLRRATGDGRSLAPQPLPLPLPARGFVRGARPERRGVAEHVATRRERVQLVEVHLVDDLLLERERGATLVRERRVRDRPSLVEPADEMVLGNEHVLEEHLVELRVAGDLHERSHLDPWRGHV